MWKVILGIVGLMSGVPVGWLVGSLLFFVLADRHQINWFHGDDGLAWIIPLFLVLGPVLGGGAGLLLGAMLDRTRAQRHEREASAEPDAAADCRT
jgi:hypothetical protein